MATRGMSTAALQGLRSRLASMAEPPFQSKLAQLCAAAALKLVADEFRGSHAPDGTPWEKLASRKGKPLLDTGRLRASFAVSPSGGGFRIGTAVGYAGYHQYGTRGGHRKDRLQWAGSKGRFISKSKVTPRTHAATLRFIPGGQGGAIPARPMLPGAQLPPSWTEAFAREINGAVRRAMQGAA